MKQTAELHSFLKESNAIEGIYNDDSLTQAWKAWEYLSGQDKLTVDVVLETHRLLMANQKLPENQKGHFRRVAVWIAGCEGVNWDAIPSLIDLWIKAVMQLVDGGKTVATQEVQETFAKTHHVTCEKIHPFVDGNGRTGRMFMNWQRLKLGLPLLIIEADKRWKYYEWFREQS